MSASSLWQRGSIAAVVTTALLVTGCGSSSSSGAAAAAGSSTSSAAAAGASTTPAATASSAGAAMTSAAGGAAGSTSKIVIPSEAAVTSVKATGGGDFCKDLASAVNRSAASQPGTTPAEIKQSYQADEANAIKALSKAPAAIKADVQVLVQTTAQLDAALQKVNYDFTKITAADEAALDSPAFTAATTKLEDYVKAHCGFDLGAASASS